MGLIVLTRQLTQFHIIQCHYTQPAILLDASLPNINLPNSLWSFRSIILLQFGNSYYKDVLNFLC